MNTENKINQELQELGLSNLANASKDRGFKVPDGYFDDLACSILDQLPSDSVEKKTPKRAFFNIRMVSAIAASLLILVVFALSFLFIKNGKETGVFSQIPDYAYEEYFASLDDFDRMLANDYLLEIVANELDYDELYLSQDDEALLDYLFDEVNRQKFDASFVIDLENN